MYIVNAAARDHETERLASFENLLYLMHATTIMLVATLLLYYLLYYTIANS